jgi:hypothetical protein
VSKDRFVDLIRKRFHVREVDSEQVNGLAERRNVLIWTKNCYRSTWSASKFEPQLFKMQAEEAGLHGPLGVERSQYPLPDVIAQADAHTFVSGEKLKKSLMRRRQTRPVASRRPGLSHGPQ